MPGLVASVTPSAEEFHSYWPRWRSAEKGKRLLSCRVGCSVEKLRDLLFSPRSELQKRAHSERNDKNVAESAWVDSFRKLPSIPGGYVWASEADKQECLDSKPVPGKMRKVRFTSAGMALHPNPFDVEELHRCVEHIPALLFVAEVAVASTPMYCDRFRSLNLYHIKAEGAEACRISISYQIAYIRNVSAPIRALVERSARGGMIQNFKLLSSVLGEMVPVRHLDSGNEGKELMCHKIQNLPMDVFIDEDQESILANETAWKWPGSHPKRNPLVSIIISLAMLVMLPFTILSRSLHWLLWGRQHPEYQKPSPIDALEVVVRFFCTFLLTCTLLYFAHDQLLQMEKACVEGHWCGSVFAFLDLPRSFHGTVASGVILMVVLRVVEWGLG
ncbi:hypothetical protein BSKO_03894 [Bryopsis sp. KO-2023]|nr:hypothetical protein BSKO_03894 [Bryopsis sp. KO-2023]